MSEDFVIPSDTSVDYLFDQVNYIVENMLENDFQEVRPSSIGLDGRSARRLWVNQDWIVVSKHELGSLTYYGGFEYVESEFVTSMGSFVFFSVEDSRVARHISYLF